MLFLISYLEEFQPVKYYLDLANFEEQFILICDYFRIASFLCVLSLSSVLRSFIHMYCDTGSLGKYTPTSGFSVNISKGWGELEILLEEVFLPGEGNQRRNGFDN